MLKSVSESEMAVGIETVCPVEEPNGCIQEN